MFSDFVVDGIEILLSAVSTVIKPINEVTTEMTSSFSTRDPRGTEPS